MTDRSAMPIVAALVLAAMAVSGPVSAKKIYKYVDEDGITHFTDKKPETDQEVESRQVRVDGQDLITARRVDNGSTNTYFFFNHWHGPVEIKVRFEESRNVIADPELPSHFVMMDYGEQPLVVVTPVDPRAGYNFRLVYEAVPGDPRQQPELNYRYRIPFRSSERFYIGQGFGGMATHTERHSFHAIDVTMPVGTPILAARDGIVMHVERDFFGAGLDRDKYGSRANFVRILHEDGTMAVYAHLDLESVSVRPGSTVLAGELIGLSGNTGMSSGPHLHFVIQRNNGTTLESVPFRFDDGRGGSITPEAGTWLEVRR